MKQAIFFLFVITFYVSASPTQDLFFIGEKSYICTEIIHLESNKKNSPELSLAFAKDDSKHYFALYINHRYEAIFEDKLIVYLDNGKVIATDDLIDTEYVDDKAKAIYAFNSEELEYLKNSNVNTIKYTLKVLDIKLENYSASNKGKSTVEIVEGFYK